MNRERPAYRYPVIVGFFVTIGTLILVLVIFTLGGQRGTFMSTKLVHARFTDIGGLKKGDNVWLSGVKIGMIREIRIEGRQSVLVTLGVDAKVDSLIRKDSHVRISSDGIMGNRIVMIYGGSPAEDLLSEDDVIDADVYADPQELFRTLGNSSRDVADLASNLREISEEVLEGQGMFGRLVNDSVWAETLVQSSRGLHRTISRLESTATKTGRLMESLQHAANQLQEPGNLAYGILEDTVLFHNLFEASEKLRSGMDNLSQFSNSLNQSGVALNNGQGVAGTILYDTLSARHLKGLLHNMDSASRVLEMDLRALQHSFLLRRYFRRLERKKK